MVQTGNQRRSSSRQTVQRVNDDDNQLQAERTSSRSGPSMEDLADRVYRLMVEDLRRSQEREW
jgi:hypothetical protein